MEAANAEDAIGCAVKALRKHFKLKDSSLPFGYEAKTGIFTAIDADFLSIKEMSSIRSINTRSRDFECTVATWLGKRVTGAVHRVGYPRDKKKTKEFNKHLRALGFRGPVLLGREKDGGFDILWMLPLVRRLTGRSYRFSARTECLRWKPPIFPRRREPDPWPNTVGSRRPCTFLACSLMTIYLRTQ